VNHSEESYCIQNTAKIWNQEKVVAIPHGITLNPAVHPGSIQYVSGETGARGGAVVEALRYKPEGRGIDSRWCQNFSLT
jgi:hypothetical protein